MIAEDDSFQRSFLVSVLRENLKVTDDIFEAADGEVASEIVKSESVDSVIMDLQMPHCSGVATATTIWHRNPEIRILFWSNYADEAYVRGISRIVPPRAVYGYLLKTASEERLELAVRGVFWEDQCIVDREIRGVQQRTENSFEGLRDIEFEVLMDIALGMTDKAIAVRRNLSTPGVQSHLKHLFDKLGVTRSIDQFADLPLHNSRTRAVAIAFSRGLLNMDGVTDAQKDLDAWMEKSNP